MPAAPFFTRLNWYLLKLPLTLVLIVAGFLLEALMEWPLALLCWLHTRRDGHANDAARAAPEAQGRLSD